MEIAKQHELHIMTPADGDQTLTWVEGEVETIDQARVAFDLAMGKGYAAFAATATEEGERIHKFDPGAWNIIMVAPIAGG